MAANFIRDLLFSFYCVDPAVITKRETGSSWRLRAVQNLHTRGQGIPSYIAHSTPLVRTGTAPTGRCLVCRICSFGMTSLYSALMVVFSLRTPNCLISTVTGVGGLFTSCISHTFAMSHWSSGLTVYFLPQGAADHALEMQPTLWNWDYLLALSWKRELMCERKTVQWTVEEVQPE